MLHRNFTHNYCQHTFKQWQKQEWTKEHVVVLKCMYWLHIMTICYMQGNQKILKNEWVDIAGHCSMELNMYNQPCNGARMVWSSNHGSGKTFFLSPECPDQLWGSPSLQFNGSFLGVKQPRHYADHSPSSSAMHMCLHDMDMDFACYLSLSN